MKNIFLLLVAVNFTQLVTAQQKNNLYAGVQYTTTINDVVKENNPWGAGVNATLFIKAHCFIKPVIELSSDVYLEDKKVLTVQNGKNVERVNSVTSLSGGLAYFPSQRFFVALTGGAALVNKNIEPLVKPGIGFMLDKSNKFLVKASYNHIFNRENVIDENFASVSIGVGVKIF